MTTEPRARARRAPVSWPAAVLLGLVAGLLAAAAVELLPGLELASLDARFRLRGPRKVDDSVVMVLVDDKGLESIGRWSDYARILDALDRLGARLVVSDIVFRHAGEDADSLIAANRRIRVVHPVAVGLLPPGDWPADGAVAADGTPLLPSLRARAYPQDMPPGSLLAIDEVLAPHEALLEAAAGVGHIGAPMDEDGVLRRIPLAAWLDGKVFPSTALEAARLVLGAAPEQVRVVDGRIEIARPTGEDVHIPCDARGRVLVDHLGSWADPPLPFIAAEQLLEPGADLREAVAGKVCYLGVAGTGNTDLANTPFDSQAKSPCLLVLATLLDQILAGRHLACGPAWLAWALSVLLGLAVAWQSRAQSLLAIACAGIAGLLAVAGGSLVAMLALDSVLPTAAPLLAVLIGCAGAVGMRLVIAERARRRVISTFGRYLSQAVLDKVLDEGQEIASRGERKELTILFSDIVRFSDFCNQVEPERVHALLNEYLEEMVGCVFGREGTVDKFIGDGLLAFFGDPLPQSDHARRAVRSALDMLEKVEQLNARWHAQGQHTIQIRIGINTGPVIVGNVGAQRRLEYTVLGDQVNRAQRLEAAARPGCVLISETTFRQVEADFPEARSVGEVAGKREERYPAWELAGPEADPGC
ncbi:MAG: adenylate/guanylate cyclase domain-containing protein [Deltaproteobacteria bacterium]|nr:adenylate/guanylate cyclase domain-containing protein [Deltaproteobacteria bacterium]